MIAPFILVPLPGRIKKTEAQSSYMAKVTHVEIEPGKNSDAKTHDLPLREKRRIQKENLGGLCTWLEK